jgi:hypothetical protein
LHPEYLVLATEVNFMYHLNRPEFDHFLTLYRQAYSEVKAISPSTQVSISYHMDMMFAYSQFEILEMVGPQDFVAFTSYPAWLVYSGFFPSVQDIPLWWYGRLKLLIAKPIVFSEIAWPSAGRGNLEDQEQFVQRLPELLRIVNPELVTWALQHDVKHFRTEWLNEQQSLILQGFEVDAAELFTELNSMGLLSWDGPPKPAWFRALEWPSDFTRK